MKADRFALIRCLRTFLLESRLRADGEGLRPDDFCVCGVLTASGARDLRVSLPRFLIEHV